MCAKQRIIATFRNKSHTVMITSVKVKFRASRVSGKAGTIYYQLTHLRRTRCITTGIRLMPGEWDASRSGPSLRSRAAFRSGSAA